jgi:hypothetical protein
MRGLRHLLQAKFACRGGDGGIVAERVLVLASRSSRWLGGVGAILAILTACAANSPDTLTESQSLSYGFRSGTLPLPAKMNRAEAISLAEAALAKGEQLASVSVVAEEVAVAWSIR